MRIVPERNEQNSNDPNIIEIDSTLLRDYFAGQALVGILGMERDAFNNPDKAAEWAYGLANAMMKERSSYE